MSHNHTWEEAQEEELGFWNTPGAELGEQLKQLTYAKYLGLQFEHDGNSPFVINKTGMNIVDIGGGPVSLLLKTKAWLKIVIDPCPYPKWVLDRYSANGVDWMKMPGEDFTDMMPQADEIWMYNVLQHTSDPQKIFHNIYDNLKEGGTFRFVDWVDTPTNAAHPVSLTYQEVGEMIIAAGFTSDPGIYLNEKEINENQAVGKIAYGIFKK